MRKGGMQRSVAGLFKLVYSSSFLTKGRKQMPAQPPYSMKPRIRFAKATDGVNIAFWTLGEGAPLVYMTGGPWNHIELWQIPECQLWYERIGRQRMLVRYDVRGTGMSERNVTDFSLETQLLDVEAVVGKLGLEKFDLFGAAGAGPAAVAYAVRHPDRVQHLILWCAWANTSAVQGPRIQAWLSLIGQDWELMTDTCAQIVLGWSGGEIGHHAADNLRKSVTQEVARAALTAMGSYDVTEFLPKIQSPTLVLHRNNIAWIPIDIAKQLASEIPDSRLMILAGESPAPYLGDMEPAIEAIAEFLREGGAERLPVGGSAKSDTYPDGLTQREAEVLRLIAGGKTNNEIAKELFLSVRTVERHIGNAYGKIDARGRADATAYALTHQLL